MIFQVTHTHNHETCPGANPDKFTTFSEWWAGVKNNSSVKVLGS